MWLMKTKMYACLIGTDSLLFGRALHFSPNFALFIQNQSVSMGSFIFAERPEGRRRRSGYRNVK